MDIRSFSDFLFAAPSFLGGMARVLDFADTLTEYNTALTPEQEDALARAADWRAVGDDLYRVMVEYAAEYPELAVTPPSSATQE